MVRTTRWLLSAILALACLAGCNLLAGIFPDRLMSLEAFADLSGYIDPGHLGDYNFEIIRDSSSGAEYLVLATDDGSYGDDCVVVFDRDLRVLGHYSLVQLDRMDSANPFAGRGAMVDASGRIVVGNRRFTIGGRSLVYYGTPPTLNAYGVAVPESATPNFGDLHAENSTMVFLRYTGYQSDWTGATSYGPEMGPGPGCQLGGLWLRTGDLLMLSRRDAVPWQIYKLPRYLFATGALCTPLEGCYVAGSVPTPDGLRWNTLGYTDAGFAVYWDAGSQYILFDETGAVNAYSDTVADSGDRPYNQRHLYGRTSGWYVLDGNELSLERRKWWWQ